MSLENIFNFPIQALQRAVFTPISSLIAIFSVMLLIVLYHWSGLDEKIDNLRGIKKIIIFFLVTLVILSFYYVFYKAGKFDKIVNNPTFKIITEKIGEFIDRSSKQ